MALARDLAVLPYCYLTTVGRVSGNAHTIEIWFGDDPSRDRIFVLSGGGDRSDWVRNLIARPSVRVRIGEQEWNANARVVEDPTDDEQARTLLAAKYQRWREGEPRSEWARTALPIEITFDR